MSCLFKHPILTDEVALQEFERSSELLQFFTEFDCRFSAFASCKLLEDSSVQAFEIVLELAEFNCGISWMSHQKDFLRLHHVNCWKIRQCKHLKCP
jgi:hypothetical protein